MFTVRKQRVSLPAEAMAREIAERSVAGTLQQLREDAVNMLPAELRGYVRAHALSFVREEATQLVGREWPAEAFAELVATAMERATHLVVQQLKLHPIAVVPTPHVRLRIAA